MCVSPSFAGALMENWQSEFLQFSLFIGATIWLVQKGSNESSELDETGTEDDRTQQIGRFTPIGGPRRRATQRHPRPASTRTRSCS